MKRQPLCRRKGCDAPRERWQFVCQACWFEIPRAERDRYLRPARARLTRIAKQIAEELLRALGRKPAAAPAAAQAYARTCAMLGEHDA